MSGTVGGPVIGSRGTGVIGGKKFYRFTSGTSVLYIPEFASMVAIECVGSGGAGGGGGCGSVPDGGGGGGGGSIARIRVPTEGLGETLTITIPSVAAGGAGGTGNSVPGVDGASGGSVTVTDDDTSKVILTAFGGGGGDGSNAVNNAGAAGGGGGGTGGVGEVGSGNTGGNGGEPYIEGSTQGDSLGGRGAKGGNNDTDGDSAE